MFISDVNCKTMLTLDNSLNVSNDLREQNYLSNYIDTMEQM